MLHFSDMRLYSALASLFIDDVFHDRIAGKLVDAFFHNFRFRPSQGEVNSWRNSLRAVSQSIERAAPPEGGIILELQLPLSSMRLDCLIAGHDESNEPNAVIVELKQWEKCSESSTKNEVTTWVGGNLRDALHPSVQVDQYRMYLLDCHAAFVPIGGISLHACSFLHNYHFEDSDPILAPKFSEVLKKCPLFSAADSSKLVEFIRPCVVRGAGMPLVRRIEEDSYAVSKKLLDHVANLIAGKPEYILLDEQLVVFDKVVAEAARGFEQGRKTVIIVRGGPGTGKSVIAMRLLGELSGRGLNTHYVTGSKAFTRTIREIVGARAGAQIKYTHHYAAAEPDSIDVLVCDEAHRIRETSNTRFTPPAERSELPQIQELIRSGKNIVCFIDDNQIVRPGEIGSAQYIRQHAERKNCTVFEYGLASQFRCGGSDAFVQWVNNTLNIERTPVVLWSADERFDFRIFSTPHELESAIRMKHQEKHSARLTAGFCWKWSSPRPNGMLVDDVVIGDFAKPWNAKSDAGRLAPGIPKESLWAYDPAGIEQIGCVYSAQGFEFDYVGVIFGNDLTYDLSQGGWVTHREHSADSVVRRATQDFERLVKNTYRVLLTRGLKGCYVYFMDKDTESFFRTRIESHPA